MKRLLVWKLRRLSRAILAKYHPTVIGITGSVGKTSTKEAVFCVLRAHTSARRNPKSYNNEFGIPLTIIGASSGNRSLARWVGILLKALRLFIIPDPSYPKTLILEMGIDRPGEMALHTSIAPCDIAVITAVAAVHTEYFGTVDNVLEEKAAILATLKEGGSVVLNYDDVRVRGLAERSQDWRCMTYGFSEGADVRSGEPSFLLEDGKPTGIQFTISAGSERETVHLEGVLGRQQISSILAAVAVGRVSGMTLPSIITALEHFEGPPGRMRLLPGIKRTLLLDDTYNASMRSVHAALETLVSLPFFTRKIACLGDMAELGQYSDEGHAAIGQFVAEQKIDFLVTVGALGRQIAASASSHGMQPDKIASFDHATEAGKYLQDLLRENDCALVKGSQSLRMERIVKEVMAEPERAEELLVRQDPSWLAKP